MESGARTWWDPFLLFAAFLVAAWLAPLLPSGTVPIQAALGAVAVFALLARVWGDRRGVGVRVDNLTSSLLVFLVACGLLALPVVAVEGVGSFSADEVPSYFVWATYQQFLVIAGFWRPVRGTLGPPGPFRRELAAALLAAGVFTLAHAPNLPLMGLVLLAEALGLVLFSRFRNLFSLSLAHALAALVASHSGWISSMRVGLAYWRQ